MENVVHFTNCEKKAINCLAKAILFVEDTVEREEIDVMTKFNEKHNITSDMGDNMNAGDAISVIKTMDADKKERVYSYLHNFVDDSTWALICSQFDLK